MPTTQLYLLQSDHSHSLEVITSFMAISVITASSWWYMKYLYVHSYFTGGLISYAAVREVIACSFFRSNLGLRS